MANARRYKTHNEYCLCHSRDLIAIVLFGY